jgi:hypothetical protein
VKSPPTRSPSAVCVIALTLPLNPSQILNEEELLPSEFNPAI